MSAAMGPLRVGMLMGSAIQTCGIVEVVKSLSCALERRGNVTVEVFTLEQPEGDMPDLGQTPVHCAPVIGPRGFSFAPDLVSMMQARALDCVHVHGLWNYLSFAARRWHQLARRPYIVSPHGMLDRLADPGAGMRERVARLLFEDAPIRNAAALHVASPAEQRSVAAAGYALPARVIPPGVEPGAQDGPPAPWLEPLGPDARVLLFVGKLVPSRGLSTLLRAWHRVAGSEQGAGWHLVIVGALEGEHAMALQAEAQVLELGSSVHFVGQAMGAERAAAYRSADAFVLPSAGELLPVNALKAFAYELPSLLTPQCSLPEAFAGGAAIRIEPEEAAIAEGLLRLFAMTPQERSRMGRAAFDLADERFDWDLAAARFEALYLAVLAQARAQAA